MVDSVSNDEEDEDLKRAIALSLAHSDPPQADQPAVDDSETESEDEDFKRAIALSLAEDKLQKDGTNEQVAEESGMDGKAFKPASIVWALELTAYSMMQEMGTP
jgi:hypothetical protein